MIIFLYWLIQRERKSKYRHQWANLFTKLTLQMKKNLKEISSFTIHKEKNILFALLFFKYEKDKNTSSVYIYDLVTNKILHTHNLQVIKNMTHITYNDINEQIVISDWDNNCIDLVLLPRTKEEKLLIKSLSCFGKEDGQVNKPLGIITQGSRIWVVDNDNNRIQKFSLSST